MGNKLFKRGNVWYAWVPREGGGTRAVSTGCTDQKAAGVIRSRLERDAADPAHAARASALTVDLLDDYLRSLSRKGRAVATVSLATTKAGHLRRLLPAFAADITHRVLEGYVDRRLAEGSGRSTIAKELGRLRAALMLARRNGSFEADVDEVMPDLEAPYVPRTRFLAPHEFMGICLALPRRRAAHVAAIVALALRWSESKRLRESHVLPGLVCIPGTKTAASKRTIPVVGLFGVILAWSLRGAPGRGKDRPLFDRWPNAIRDIKAACKRLGYAPASPNDLRRTTSSWLRGEGVEPHVIGALMGHTTSAMVERVYGRLHHEGLRKLLEEKTDGGALGGESLMRGAGDFSGAFESNETRRTATVSACFAANGGVSCSPAHVDDWPSKPKVVRSNRSGRTEKTRPTARSAGGPWRHESLMRGAFASRMAHRAFWATARAWFRGAA